MSVEENKQLIQRLFDEVINHHHTEVLDEVFKPGSMIGDSFKDTMELMQTAFPDAEATIEHMFGEGDEIAVVFNIQGTHTGPFMGQSATGISFYFTGIHYYQFQGGRVYTARYEHDLLGLLEQLGMAPLGSRPDI